MGEEREKLLHAYYAGAVPVDLLRSEQDRLANETGQAERHLETAEISFTDVEDTLGKALDLLADCERAYQDAPGHLRRQWNQALFERLVVYDDRIGEAEVAEPFATLAEQVAAPFPRHNEIRRGKSLPSASEVSAATQAGNSFGAGSNEVDLMGEAGFEPA